MTITWTPVAPTLMVIMPVTRRTYIDTEVECGERRVEVRVRDGLGMG